MIGSRKDEALIGKDRVWLVLRRKAGSFRRRGLEEVVVLNHKCNIIMVGKVEVVSNRLLLLLARLLTVWIMR